MVKSITQLSVRFKKFRDDLGNTINNFIKVMI